MIKLIIIDTFINELTVQELESGEVLFRIEGISDIDFAEHQKSFTFGVAANDSLYFSMFFKIFDNDQVLIRNCAGEEVLTGKDLRKILSKNEVEIMKKTITLDTIEDFVMNDLLQDEEEGE